MVFYYGHRSNSLGLTQWVWIELYLVQEVNASWSYAGVGILSTKLFTFPVAWACKLINAK